MRLGLLFSGCAAALFLASALAAPAAVAKDGERLSSRKDWSVAVRTALAANKPRPEAFRSVGGNLVTRVGFKVGPDGAVADIEVRRSSGVEAADAAALDMVRAAGRLPAFTPDMERKPVSMVIPVRLILPLKEDQEQTLFVDSQSGFRIEVPPSLALRRQRSQPPYDILVDVVAAAGGAAPFAMAGEGVCMVGYQKNEDAPPTQDALNEPSFVQSIADMIVGSLSERGMALEKQDVSDHRGAKLIELLLKPKPGHKGAELKTYMASFDRPGGGVIVTCAAKPDDIEAALGVFRTIRDGTEVRPQ